MNNSLKKYAVLSIIINTILILIYGYYFHHKATFSGQEIIVKGVKIVNETIVKGNNSHLEHYLYILARKPKMQKPLSKVFDDNENIINEFRQKRDSLLAGNEGMDMIFEEYNKALSNIKQCHDTTLFAIQKEAKFTDNEIAEQILNFNQHSIEGLSIYTQDLKGLASETLVFFMENHLTLARIHSDNRFSSMISYRYGYSRMNQYYPIPLSWFHDEIILGETFETDITIGSFLNFYHKKRIPLSVYLNDERIVLNDKTRYHFKIDTNSPGKQSIKTTIHWTNPTTHKTEEDSTIFEYTVTP